ncbi:MAG TPA: ribosome recycling factor, partial [Ruminococcaceae bacterium]|nr:ribosome recycling factor [Oscillospiraceae bacterium]
MKELLKNTEEKMNKTVAVLERDYKSIRAGRANIAVLDRITVDYYGCPTPIQQMAAVSVPEPRILMIQPWDATTLKEIEKAILTSDIGINPQNDGRVIRLSFPPLTEERRKDIVKEVRKAAEENK